MLLDFPLRVARHLYRRFVVAPTGTGWPVTKDTWDKEYQSGQWDFLFEISEMAHHLAVLGYVRHLHPKPRVLEAGCGSGRFLDLLRYFPLESYTGFDLSEAAVQKAKTLQVPNARLEVSSFDQWQEKGPYDIVVFDEVLWYAKDPAATFNKFATFLTPHGSIVVSMFRIGNALSIWKRIEQFAEVLDYTEIKSHSKNARWDVKALRPKK